MLPRNRTRILGLIALISAHTLPAGELKLAPVAPSAPKAATTLKAAPAAIAATPPTITGFQPAGTCLNKNTTLVVQGRSFGEPSGKGVALGGQGIHVDLPVSSWSSTSITVSIPNDSRIQGSQRYYIGIEKTDHTQWLSNINQMITTCSDKPFTVAPPTRTLPESGTKETPPADGSYPDTAAMPGAPAPMPPVSGGSLLGAALPSPPKDLPPGPSKESPTIEAGELVVVSANMADAQQLAAQAQALRLAVRRRSNLPGLGFVITVFRVPKDVGVGDALLNLRQALPNAWADANHRFQLMGDEAKSYGRKLIGWNGGANCGAGMRIGLVDTALDTDHPMLRGHQIQRRDFLTTGNIASSNEHGTATAALLVGNTVGLVPGAQLFAASIFRAREKETDTTAESVVLALNWLAENRVAIVNLSLGGPRNLLIEAAVQRLTQRGVAVVAAAGNGGEGAPPVFPAAQSGVIAVTAVDATLSPYKRANRGDYIAFAAPGVDVWTAAAGGDGVFVSGTSYAVPFATAALAALRLANGNASWPVIIKQLQGQARDLGNAGKDPVFGWGLLQSGGCAARQR